MQTYNNYGQQRKGLYQFTRAFTKVHGRLLENIVEGKEAHHTRANYYVD